MTSPHPILIAGGGIGGLSLALALNQRGLACEVYETVPEVKELGVGITLLPHAMRELAALGVPALVTTGYADTDQLPEALRGLPRLSKPYTEPDLERAMADVEERGRLAVARIEAETSVNVAELVAKALEGFRPKAVKRVMESAALIKAPVVQITTTAPRRLAGRNVLAGPVTALAAAHRVQGADTPAP